MFMKKKFILGVLYFSAATAQGKLVPRGFDSSNPYRVESAVPEVREVAPLALGGERAGFTVLDSLPSDAAASAGDVYD